MLISYKYLFFTFIGTFPYWILSYYPFWNHLRFSKAASLGISLGSELVLITFLGFCAQAGAPEEIDFSFIPVCLIVDLITIKIQPAILLFFFLFIMDYLLLVRGLVDFFLTLFFPGAVFLSWPGFAMHLAILCITLPLIFFFLKHTSRRMMEVNAPSLWRFFWLIPCLFTIVVLMFTFHKSVTEVGQIPFLTARIGSILCVFIVYYILLRSLNNLRQQMLLKHQAQSSAQLIMAQKKQYELIMTQMENIREARHDLRQHLKVIQSYINDDKSSLEDYIRLYAQNLPADTTTIYCQNPSVNIITNYYANTAREAGISFLCTMGQLPMTLFVSEPEFCVLLGNLLENALEAEMAFCKVGRPFIRVNACVKDQSSLILTVDNGPAAQPLSESDGFRSTKHEGMGIGILSVKNIAAHYNGITQFKWENDVFYASVFLHKP